MREVHLLARRVVWIIGIAIAFLHPYRLLHKLPCALQVVGIKLLGADVVIRIGVPHVLRLLLLVGRDLIFVALI